MNPGVINLPAIIVANGMGITLLLILFFSNTWRLKEPTKENRCLLIIFLCCLIECVLDPICFIFDGKAGLFNRILLVGSNTIVYLFGLCIAFAWIYLIAYRLNHRLHKVHRIILFVALCAFVVALIVNIFVPFIFKIDDSNSYVRTGGYWAYITLYIWFMLEGLVLYFWQKTTSGGLKFFPVWAFIIPAAIGIVAQVLYFGISTSVPFIAISLAGVVLCLQNEFMMRDKLTGLYNRAFLVSVEKKLIRHSKLRYSVIMLDINHFKEINDNNGHKIGDEALIETASTLSLTVGRMGEVVRYAGDEFIIIINSQDETIIQNLISNISQNLKNYCIENKKPYILSVACGYHFIDLKQESMDEMLDTVDKSMYLNKNHHKE